MNTTATNIVPAPTIADLRNLKLQGTVSQGGLDIATLSTPNGNVVAQAQDSLLGLAGNWHGAEFNLFGDCCSFEAFLNSGSSLTVRLSADNGTQNTPTCTANFSAFTTETNNLNLGSCSPFGGASPAIVFPESGGGALPSGYTIGDTHLTTFYGVHYDFQASGEFVLVQADPGLIVQTRQNPAPTNPSVSVNTAVATIMQGNRVAICLTGLWVDGSPRTLADGASLTLPLGVTVSRTGSVYTSSSPSGDVVRANLSPGNYMDVSVALGATNPNKIRGLLGGEGAEPHELVDGYGRPLRRPFSYSELREYADSWRVRSAESLLRCDKEIPPGWPKGPIYADNLPTPEREHARSVCLKAGVRNETLLDDCILDVSLLGNDKAADVFVNVPAVDFPTQALRPTYP